MLKHISVHHPVKLKKNAFVNALGSLFLQIVQFPRSDESTNLSRTQNEIGHNGIEHHSGLVRDRVE